MTRSAAVCGIATLVGAGCGGQSMGPLSVAPVAVEVTVAVDVTAPPPVPRLPELATRRRAPDRGDGVLEAPTITIPPPVRSRSGPDHTPAWDATTTARLITCETGGTNDPTIISRAGAHGLFQFHLESWRLVGGTGIPSDAPATEQATRARALWERQGWHGWPGCSCLFGWISSWSYAGVIHVC